MRWSGNAIHAVVLRQRVYKLSFITHIEPEKAHLPEGLKTSKIARSIDASVGLEFAHLKAELSCSFLFKKINGSTGGW